MSPFVKVKTSTIDPVTGAHEIFTVNADRILWVDDEASAIVMEGKHTISLEPGSCKALVMFLDSWSALEPPTREEYAFTHVAYDFAERSDTIQYDKDGDPIGF